MKDDFGDALTTLLWLVGIFGGLYLIITFLF